MLPISRIMTSICFSVLAVNAQANKSDWVEKSDEYTRAILVSDADFFPETASSTGMAEFDARCLDLSLDLEARVVASNNKNLATLSKALGKETNSNIKQDLQLLIDAIEQANDGMALEEQYLVPWEDVPRQIFSGLSRLLDAQLPDERQQAALSRLQCYIGGADSTPITEKSKERFQQKAGDQQLLGPNRESVMQAIERVPAFIKGLNALFKERGIAGYEKPMAQLEMQLEDYVDWLNVSVLPRSREGFILPAPLYAHRLKTMGIDIDPERLIENAKVSFMQTRGAMDALALQIAAAEDSEVSDYRDVIRLLKEKPITVDNLESHYRSVNKILEKAIADNKIVDLPKRDMIMRLASEAESASQPAPHMLPPPFIGNKGEMGQFVLTAGNPNASAGAVYDDFNFDAVAYTLSAHEGRPGHELQFSAMLENGVSLARVYYAFNSVNVEGWALYAEAEMLPYEPLEGQMIALQHRLLRAARAMLDPMLNLGRITPEVATQFLLNEVVLSEAMTKQEVDRYTIRAPGQAGSYFYGYSRLLQMRAETELALGDKFDRLAFNNFILAQGLLPPTIIAKAVREEFIGAVVETVAGPVKEAAVAPVKGK